MGCREVSSGGMHCIMWEVLVLMVKEFKAHVSCLNVCNVCVLCDCLACPDWLHLVLVNLPFHLCHLCKSFFPFVPVRWLCLDLFPAAPVCRRSVPFKMLSCWILVS